MSKLKPCPFCGNEYPTMTHSQTGGWLIRCPACNISFELDYYSHRGELGKQRYVEAWNRRAGDNND